MYTIRHAAELTGVPPATLRAWERRYGIGATHRTPAGYRLYEEQTVRTLSRMAALVAQGWAPRQAAEEALAAQAAAPESSPDGADRPIGQGARGGAEPGRADGVGAGGDPGRADPDLDISELVDAATRLDASQLSAALDARFATTSFETVVDRWLLPGLIALGEAWEQGRVSVAGEHLAAHTVMRRLAAAYDAAASIPTGPRILVGLPPGARHELGVLAFAVAARRAGLHTTYLGADLPVDEWVAAVQRHRAEAVVLSAPRVEDLPALNAVVSALRASDPGLVIGVGGALQDDAPHDCLSLGHEIGAGVRILTAALTDTPRAAVP